MDAVEVDGADAPEPEKPAEEPQTLDAYTAPKRGYMDRMLRPQRGMDEKSWGGKAFFKCPRCGAEAFDPVVAKAHRC